MLGSEEGGRPEISTRDVGAVDMVDSEGNMFSDVLLSSEISICETGAGLLVFRLAESFFCRLPAFPLA